MKKSKLLDLYRFFYLKKPMVLVLYGCCFTLASGLLISSINLWLGGDTTFQFMKDGIIHDFLVRVFFVPLLITLFFQYLPLKVAGWFKKPPYFLIMLIASLIYAGIHYSPFERFVVIFLNGLCWAFFCLLLMRRKKHPVFYVWLMHASPVAFLLGVYWLWPK